MAVLAHAVEVGTEPVQLDTESSESVIVYNNGASTLYIGGSAVDSDEGGPVPAGTWSPPFGLAEREHLFGVVASGTVEVRVLEVGV